MDRHPLIKDFKRIVGSSYVLHGARATRRFRRGFRSGEGDALCVVRPGSLLEQWRVMQLCVEENLAVIMQASNTGLTEGSTPKGHYDRDVVIISTTRMDRIHLIQEGRQAIAFPGATLHRLEAELKSIGRNPHSVIGSSCLGASVIGGICNNSGGALIARGPAYTELSLFARINEDGKLELVNHLGIDLGADAEKMLGTLDSWNIHEEDIKESRSKASDRDYSSIVRDVDAPSPARFNADPRCLHESSGSAGKLAVFAVRVDTFEQPAEEVCFYIGTNDPHALSSLRRSILQTGTKLPVSGEYLHQDCFDIARIYGKDTVLMIRALGTDRLPFFFALKGRMDAWLPSGFSDKILQLISRLFPEHLPKRMLDYREKYEHHLILKVEDEGIQETRELLKNMHEHERLAYFECNAEEASLAGLHRFAAAGAAVRYEAIHSNEVEGILALDIALRRNDEAWIEELPEDIESKLLHKLYYGHFFCHVFHQDYIIRKGADTETLKEKMLALLDKRGAEYPAEHNVGHLYAAKPALRDFYRQLDPTNSLNPGIGKLSKQKHYQEEK